MRAAAAMALGALLLCGCAGLKAGLGDKGPVIEARVTSPVHSGEERTAAIIAAQRQVVGEVLELFISSTTRAAAAAVLEEKVLSSPRAYIRRYQVLPASGPAQVRLLALVATDKLRKELDGLGLVRPEGVYGTPRLLVSLKESGPGAGLEVGRASDALRRGLGLRGYDVLDFSDRLDPKSQKTGTPDEARAAAKAASAQVVISGTAQAQALADERLAGLRPFRARVAARASWAGTGAALAEVDVEATAVDLAAQTAAGKALEDAGQLAAEKLAAGFSGRFRERSVIDLAAGGFSELGRVKGFVADLRGLSGVAGAAVTALNTETVLLQVFVEKLAPEELAALLLRLPGYSLEVRAVDTDYRFVEVETTRRGGTKQGPPSYDR
jgi:hypothetical protein